MSSTFQLAQCNISKLKSELGHISMIEFTSFLEPVNIFADNSKGFVWRLKDPEGLASSRMDEVFEDPMMIINISVWKDIESLNAFTFGTVHNYFLKNRTKWMDKVEKVQFVMWWIKEGHIPTIEEAKSKLRLLEESGPTLGAFNWQHKFEPNGE
jgi:hypothetical protein